MASKPLEDDLIAQISGGTLDETREIAEFINAHGGSVSYGDTMKDEVNEWLRAHHKEIGISRASFSKWSYEPNAYGLNNADGTAAVTGQKELMARLREVYGE